MNFHLTHIVNEFTHSGQCCDLVWKAMLCFGMERKIKFIKLPEIFTVSTIYIETSLNPRLGSATKDIKL